MKTTIVTIHEAKTNLSRVLRKAADGEEIVISRGSQPVARLVPIVEKDRKRRPRSLKDRLVVGPEFFDELPPDELAAWD